MFLTHIDENGNDSPAILVPNCTAANRAVNIPEFLNADYDALDEIEVPAVKHHRWLAQGIEELAAGRIDEAIALYQRALEAEPEFSRAHANLGMAYAEQERYDEALTHLEQAIRVNAKDAFTWNALGWVQAQLGHMDDALGRYEVALQLSPSNPFVHNNLGLAMRQLGRPDRAIEHFERAVELYPDYGDAWKNLGFELVAQGRRPRRSRRTARPSPSTTRTRSPSAAPGSILLELGTGRGRPPLPGTRGRGADPDDVTSRLGLAWQLATHPDASIRDGARAVVHATAACELTAWEQPGPLDVLAAAYAEAGRYDEAVETAARAATLAAEGRGPVGSGLAERQALYARKKPFHRRPAGSRSRRRRPAGPGPVRAGWDRAFGGPSGPRDPRCLLPAVPPAAHDPPAVRRVVAGRGPGAGRRLPTLRLPARASRTASRARCATTPAGVTIEAQGPPARLDAFAAAPRGRGAGPGLRRRGGADRRARRGVRARAPFSIVASDHAPAERGRVTVDAATCADCLREALDPADRRYRHALDQLHELRTALHDRARPALRPAAHDDGAVPDVPGVRGRVRRRRRPALPRPAELLPGVRPAPARWSTRTARRCAGEDPIADAAALLAAGRIVAVKGLGGYHLAVDALSEDAVARLRRGKRRDHKPFAVMVARPRGGSAARGRSPTRRRPPSSRRRARSCSRRAGTRRTGSRPGRAGRATAWGSCWRTRRSSTCSSRTASARSS